VWGLFLILLSGPDVDKALVEKSVIEKEPPSTYIKKSVELDPEGPANAGSLRQIARSWMAEGRSLAEAEQLLKLGTELHPKSATLHEGLGEVYLRQGINNQAIESYQKALELDPNLPQAKAALKKLRP
jgi:Flp pilus assembly protein TadD